MNKLVQVKAAIVQREIDDANAKRRAEGRPFDIAHLTGTGKFSFDDTERAEIKKFVESGGLLVVDCAGGNEEFATAAERELGKIFGADSEQLATPLAASNALYRAGIGIAEPLEFRPFAQRRLGKNNGAQLRGITLNGRLAVIYSKEDLSAGLVGETVDGIAGYTSAAATVIMRDVVLYVNH
jgi:hypothetical protein